MKKTVAVVIPVHNEERRLVEAIKSIVDTNACQVKFYIIDDASTDNTKAIVEEYLADQNVSSEVAGNVKSKGAGFCRNIGFERVKEDYVLFLDADDFLFPGMLDKALGLAVSSSAQVVLTEYDRVYGSGEKKLGMNHHDEKIFERLKSHKGDTSFPLDKAGYSVELTNYPWNKLLLTEYAKQIGLYFSETPVHNDVFAHWQVMLNATRISVLHESFCGHRVSVYANQITNISDERRMAMLDVFGELDGYFNKRPELKKKYYHFFVDFKMKLYRWGSSRIDDKHRDRFKEEFGKSFASMSHGDFLSLSEKMPSVAVEALRHRLLIA